MSWVKMNLEMKKKMSEEEIEYRKRCKKALGNCIVDGGRK